MITIDKQIYRFSKDNVPAASCKAGETVRFITEDCFGGQIREDSDIPVKIDHGNVNPAAGPLYVHGASKGDALKVEILDIRTADRGVTCICEDCGPLWKLSEPLTRIIEVKDGYAIYKDIRIKADTMIGVIGTAAERDIPTSDVFENGGNMDSPVVTKGSIVYLPVDVDGGLLAMGDLHACMADGEVVGTGLEIAGEVTAKIDVIKNFKLNWMISETKDMWYVHTRGNTCDEAIENGYLEMQKLLAAAYGWTLSETAMYMTMCGSLNANQACLSSEGGGNCFRIGTPKIEGKRGLIWRKEDE